MDSFEWNKIFGALLGCAFAVMALTFLSQSIFATHPPLQAGFEIEGGAVAATGTAAQEAQEIESASAMMASMELAIGAKIAKKCAACHTFDKGGKHKVGPALFDIVNRPIAVQDGFNYSSALKSFGAGKVWDYDILNEFVYKPKTLVKGTSMGFAGLKKVEDRAALILYLRSLADNPAPMPNP